MSAEAERGLRERLGRLKSLPLLHRTGVSGEEERLRKQLDSISRKDATEDEIWSFVELARHPDRPYTLDYVDMILDDWVELHEAELPLFCLLTDPTTGGAMASFATLGDVVVAEPGALLAFTGPRVVQELVKEKLSDDFGRAEQNLRFGQIDAIVPRSEQRAYLARLLSLFER